MLSEIEQPEAVRQVMDVRIAIIENGLQLFRGPLRDSASVAFEKLTRRGREQLTRELIWPRNPDDFWSVCPIPSAYF
jgi:hypothetical protein